VEFVGFGNVHAAFLNESRTRGSVQRSVLEIRAVESHPLGAGPCFAARCWNAFFPRRADNDGESKCVDKLRTRRIKMVVLRGMILPIGRCQPFCN
jgi:hypothetical protein